MHRSLLTTLTALIALPALVVGPALSATAAGAAASPSLHWQATIDGHDLSTADSNDPVPLRPGRDAQVRLSVSNPGPGKVTIRTVRLEGRVIGMSFFVFSTRVDLTVPAGTSQDRTIQLDLSDLGDQAVGLIPARMSLLAPDRSVIADRSLATDVRGSLRSAYGIFGLAVGAITLILILSLAFEVARHLLPPNRWRRAVRFLAPGLGVGLSATFTLSATRILIPSATVWVPLVLGCGAAGFIIGYLTPRPDDEEEYQYEDGGYPGVLDVRGREQLEEQPAPALESEAWPGPRRQIP